MTAFIPVKNSSNVDSVSFDPDTESLLVRFKHGGTYRYEGVSAKKYQELMAAPSIGKHVHTHIKGSHKHSKVPD